MFLHKYTHILIYLHYKQENKTQNIQIEQGKKNKHYYSHYLKVFSLILVSLLALQFWLLNAQ